MAKEKQSKMRKKIHDLCEENEYYSIKQNRNRARSITVGTAFGGVVEVNMRSDAGSVYAQLQPIEAIELLEQIAAGIGVEIAMRPKNNFASWRGWEEVIGQRIPLEHIAWKGAAAWQFDAKDPEPKQLEAEKEPKQLEAEKEPKQSAAEEIKKSEKKPARKSRRTRKKIKETENE